MKFSKNDLPKPSTAIPLAMVMFLTSILYSFGQTAPRTKEEIRAVWLTTVSGLDWPKTIVRNQHDIERQKRELTDILDQYVNANINTVLLQTRIRGSVIYPSRIEPWDECLTGVPGKSPGYDPLAFAIEECHKRGLELHAWIVSIPLGKVQKQKAFGRQSITRKHPRLCKTSRGEVFMIPGRPETADYIADLCRELTTNYDIDGIQLDYIRYPEKLHRFSDDNLYSPSSGMTRDEWKRENITRIVRKVHDAVKPLKPWVKLSSSPIGKYSNLPRYHSGGWNCLTGVYQDPQLWLRENLQDFLCPMMYFRGDHFYPFLFDWRENTYGHPVAPGLGIYMLHPREGKWTLDEVRAEMHTIRNTDIGGIAFYRSRFLTDNTKGLYTTVCDEFFQRPALTPRMTWGSDTIAPPPPAFLSRDGNQLSWTEVPHEDGGILYNVYASHTYPVDITNPDNLLAARVRTPNYSLLAPNSLRAFSASIGFCLSQSRLGIVQTLFDSPLAAPSIQHSSSKLDSAFGLHENSSFLIPNSSLFFAITASDRYGNESDAVQEYIDPSLLQHEEESRKRFLGADDRLMVHFPEEEGTLAVYICDLAGKRIRIATYPDRINVRKLQPGLYKLIRIKKKNRIQTIGFVKL